MAAPDAPVHVEGPIWLIPGEQRGRFPRAHSVLIRDRSQTALIDTGCGVEVLRGLTEPVDLVINTHTHPDHSAGNFVFRDQPILVPEPGLETAGDLTLLSRRFFPDSSELRSRWRAFIRRSMGYGEQRPTGVFAVESTLWVGATRLEVIHAPGHTCDHCCLWVEALGLLISADVDLTHFGPWYGHPESDLRTFRDAISRLRALRPRVVVSSHRPPVRRDVDGAFARFLEVFERREAALLELLCQERTLDQLIDAATIYGRFPYEVALMRSWEGRMIALHLEEMIEAGRVRRTEAGGLIRSSAAQY